MQSNAVFEKESLANLNGQSFNGFRINILLFSLAYHENDKLIFFATADTLIKKIYFLGSQYHCLAKGK